MKKQEMALARIKTDLSRLTAVVPTLTHANGAGRVFELYLMMRVARKLKDGGWHVEPLDHKGAPLAGGVFVQRGGAPTGILPAMASNGASSIRIQRNVNDKVYEILNGIQFMGRSKALHEIDIAIVPSGVVEALRAGVNEGYPVGRPPLQLNVRMWGQMVPPDEMRSVIARMYDLTILDSHRAYVFGGGLPSGSIFAGQPVGPWVSHGSSAKTFLEENKRSLCVLARRTGVTIGAYQMTGLFHVKTYAWVDRGTKSAGSFAKDVVAWINANL